MKMKKTTFILLGLLISTHAVSQEAGSLDPTFGGGGKVLTSIGSEAVAHGVVIQDDNKIVVAGYSFNDVSGNDVTLVRYLENGDLDTDFGTDGVVTTDIQTGSDDQIFDLVLQSDGKLVVCGSSDDGSDKDAVIVRYLSDGSLDESFGIDGIVLTDFDDGKADEARVVKIHELTGNIIIGGAGTIDPSHSIPVIARYTDDGTLDATFDTDGIRTLWITATDDDYYFSIEDLALQSTGKITAVGYRDFPGLSWDSDYWAGRVNTDGSMDETFSTDGVAVYNGAFNGHDRAFGLILNPDNSFHVCGGGYITTLRYDQVLFEITPDGSVGADDVFEDYGEFLDDIAYDVQKDAEGRYVMVGSSGNDTEREFTVQRVTDLFSLDTDFSGDGKTTTTFDGNDLNEAFNLAIQPDQKIVVVGYSGNDFAIARYLGEDQPLLDEFNLTSPSNGASNQNYADLDFDWTNAFGATAYEMDIDVSADFDVSPMTYDAPGSSYNLDDLLPDTEYFWRVRATDGDTWGEYTDVWSFTTNSLENFNLISPSNGSTGINITGTELDWSAAIGATEYEVEIDVSPSFSDDPWLFSTSGTDYALPPLDLSTTYYWHVRASNDGETFGDWSDTWNFTTGSDVGIYTHQADALSIYPNPAQETLYVQGIDIQNGETVQLVALNGKSWTMQINNGELDVRDLAPGIYFLIYQNQRLKFVKE